jgi:Ser/Thr protein kinase RdoA (MazF antagonist)
MMSAPPYVGETMLAPFSTLTPDYILDALDRIGFYGDGRLQALNSFENRVYQVGMSDALPVIVKFYRPERWSEAAILEEHAFAQSLAGYEIPVVAPIADAAGQTLHSFGDFQFAVFPKQIGHAPQLDNLDDLEWMGRFIGRIHAVGALAPFVHRPTIDLQSFGEAPLAFIMTGNWLPVELAEAYGSVAKQALDGVRDCYARAGAVKILRLHGDCHRGNVLWTAQGPYFVDFDDSRMGPAIQDLWMLLSGERAEMTTQLAAVLKGYQQFYEFDPRELHLLEALRTLRLIHYSAWIARRWDDPAFPVAFPWFNTQRYWQDRILELREQVAVMEEGILEV